MNIRKVREKTGARIIFPSKSDENKELITIIGTKEGVEEAKADLLNKIKDLVSFPFQFLFLFFYHVNKIHKNYLVSLEQYC